MRPSIGFLLGRDPGTGSVLPDVVEHLRRAWAHVEIIVWDGCLPTRLLGADLVALRGLSADGVAAARRLEEAGVRCCNSVAATALTRNKAAVVAALHSGGIPVPQSRFAETWGEVLRHAGGRAVAIKGIRGSRGSAVLLTDDLPARPPFMGPYLIQERVAHCGSDRKVYVIGEHVAGVLRPWPVSSLRDKLGEPFAPDSVEETIARRAGAALGLEVYGIDLLTDSHGPVVVDVNAFPGFKGVPQAATWVADYLLDASRGPLCAC